MARRTSGAGSKNDGAAPEFQALTEEEVVFCWRGLADQGQLSVLKLQKFMLDVSGEKLSAVQAKDLLNYMDANGDGRVGMEDFRNFMSIGRLADTDPKNFMWTPKAKYREEHGLLHVVEVSENCPKDAGLQATANLFSTSLPSHDIDRRRDGSATGSDAGDAYGVTPKSSMTPQAPAGKKKGPSRPGHTAAAAAHASGHDDDALLGEGVGGNKDAVPEKEKRERVPVDPKLLAKIDDALNRYELLSWEKFLKEEDDFKRKLFGQFALTDSNELTMSEYHKMLMKWHKLAKWCMPGDLRPGDSLASMEYLLRRDREAQKPAANTEADESAVASAAPSNAEAKLPYKLWIDLLNGKYRPEEHITARTDKH